MESTTYRRGIQMFPVNSSLVQTDTMESVEESFRRLTEVIDRNFQEVLNFLGELGGSDRSLAPFAALFGGIHARADLQTASDTRIPHTLGAVPSFIMLAVDMDGLGGAVYGHSGGDPASGGTLNFLPWTANEVYLRASRAGDFQVVII